jgi:hypothetical protein
MTTNGQVLIGSTAAPHIKVGNITSSDTSLTYTLGSGTIDSAISNTYLRVAQVAISSAQVLTFDTIPVTLVPAPGAGNFIEFLSLVLIYDFNSIPYAVGDNLAVFYTNASGPTLGNFDAQSLSESSDQVFTFVNTASIIDTTPSTATLLVNTPLVLAANLGGPFTLGNSPLTVRVSYRIHPTGL